MRAIILGTGDAFTRAHFGSSALIEAPRGLVLLDCPDPIHRAIHEAAGANQWAADVAGIDDVIVTHLHGDHANGLESFGFYRRFARLRGLSSVTPRLHAVKPVIDRLWSKLAPAMDGPFGSTDRSVLEDYFDVRILDPQTPSEIAGLRVRCRYTRHPVPTVGLLFSDGDSTLGWSGDTPFDAEHVRWLSEADLIVHETNLGPAHTDIRELNGLPEALRRKMRLIHMQDDFDVACTTIVPLQDRELLEVRAPTTLHRVAERRTR